jgi:cyclopropane fatty-acyl-phospholipid synthase-like methyltransferase
MTLQEIYDEFATTYDENRGLFDMTAVFDSFYRSLAMEGGAVLDLGCGAGDSFSGLFVDRGWSVTGVDFSARMLELANRYVPQMKTIHADMREVDFGAARFDAITAIYSLFHVPASEHADLFRKFHRWLRTGGKVMFTYATREYTGAEEFEGYKEFLGCRLYYSHKTPEALYADLNSTGFVVDAGDYLDIAGETFLWMTARKFS